MLAPTSTARRPPRSARPAGQQSLGHRDREGLVGDVGQQDAELVAAEPRRDVGRAQVAPKSLGHGHQQGVAGGMSETVVDGLEVVEIEEEGGHGAWTAPGSEGCLGRLDEAASVGQPGQWVMEGRVAELRLEGPTLGDVTGKHPDQTGQARQHEQREQRGPGGDDREPAVGGGIGAHRDEDRAGDHRRRQAGHPDRAEPGHRDRVRVGQADASTDVPPKPRRRGRPRR